MAVGCRDTNCWAVWLFGLPLGLLVSAACWAAALPPPSESETQALLSGWQRFSQQVSPRATTVVTQPTLNQFSQGLLLSRSSYPMTQEYGWPALRALYRFSRDCPPLLPAQLDALPLGLHKAYQFEAALCRGVPLSDAQLMPWLTEAPLRHPAGGSYADRYLRWLQARAWIPTAEQVSTQYANWLSVDDRAHPLHAELAALTPEARDQLLSGDSWALDSQQRLWLSSPAGLRRLDAAHWQPLARDSRLQLVARDKVTVCPLPVGELCVLPRPALISSRLLVWGALVVCALWVLRLLWLRRRATQERRFVLQLLTHELRTPVASLSLALETLRVEYERLSPAGQQALGRILGDAARLERLTRTSREFLSLSGRARWPTQTVMLDEWLDGVTEKYTDLIRMVVSMEPATDVAALSVAVDLPAYWLGLCLDNLIRNALQHGRAPVLVRVQLSAQRLRLTVEDVGDGPSHPWLASVKLLCLTRGWFGRSVASASLSQRQGMGIGLFLVRRMMRRAGGRLRVQRRPSRYTLELPR